MQKGNYSSIELLDEIIKKEIEDKKQEEYALNELKKVYYIDLERYLRNEEGLYLKLKGPKYETQYIKQLRDEGFSLLYFQYISFKVNLEIVLINYP
jgi:hypothetical protein